ncbi:MAG: hypothetical protein ABI700_09665 [Chloroflexota bacterium]
MADLMVRVATPDYDTWLNAFVSAEPGLVDAGINSWTVYQDSWNNNNVLVHFIADDLDRAMAFFTSDAFKDINARSGATGRTFWVGQQPAGAPAAKKPAAKRATRAVATKAPAATTPAAKKPAAKKPAAKTPKA